jgi:hypothetical protein
MNELNKNDTITTRDEFILFVNGLASDFRKNPNEWDNDNLANYLEAIAGWVADMDGYYLNQDKKIPTQNDWSLFKDILSAAKFYE